MSLMLGKLYSALKDAGASDGAAEAAAAEVAGYESRLGTIENRLITMDGRLTTMDGRLSGIERELSLHRWVLGYLVAAVTTILFKVFA